MNKDHYSPCQLCHHRCGVDRHTSVGFCGMRAEPTLARASLHMWEEPPISGTRGSGTVFFSGCSLSCVYCQNYAISRGKVGHPVSASRLADIMLKLEADGAHNINFVTPTHFIPSVAEAIPLARARGLKIPTVYNTASYETPEALDLLSGLIDIYLPDLKYYRPETAALYSKAPDYPEAARAAIDKMVAETGSPTFDSDGIMRKGTIVRILLLPSHLAEAKLNLSYLYKTYGDTIFISLMNQYTPMPGMKPPLDRTVTHAEYDSLVDYALKLGVKNCFIQEGKTQEDSFIPPFDLTGI